MKKGLKSRMKDTHTLWILRNRKVVRRNWAIWVWVFENNWCPCILECIWQKRCPAEVSSVWSCDPNKTKDVDEFFCTIYFNSIRKSPAAYSVKTWMVHLSKETEVTMKKTTIYSAVACHGNCFLLFHIIKKKIMVVYVISLDLCCSHLMKCLYVWMWWWRKNSAPL